MTNAEEKIDKRGRKSSRLVGGAVPITGQRWWPHKRSPVETKKIYIEEQ
jgi:hypothetical protein